MDQSDDTSSHEEEYFLRRRGDEVESRESLRYRQAGKAVAGEGVGEMLQSQSR